jgi:hypothetical protein
MRSFGDRLQHRAFKQGNFRIMGSVNSTRRSGVESQVNARRPAGERDAPEAATRHDQPVARGTIPGLESRRRTPASQGSADQAEIAPENAGPNAAVRPRAALPGRAVAGNVLLWGTNALLGGLAASAAYRLARNPADFINAPAHAINGVLTFSERLGPQDLQAARQSVLDRFGQYIRPDSACHGVEPQLAFAIGNVAGAYQRDQHGTGARLYVAPYQRPGSGAHAVAHELVHCYTHPRVYDSLIATEAGRQVLDSLTEHLADKLPGTWHGQMTAYDITTMSNGRNMVGAAAALEHAVGEDTLLRAMLGGDAAAITAVSRAAVDLYPKVATIGAWNAIANAGRKRGAEQMAEAFIAASLLHEKKLPDNGDSRIWPGAHLSIRQFSDIARPQQRALLAQAAAMRERVGESAFDQAFCNFDERAALVAMRALRADLAANWQRVL